MGFTDEQNIFLHHKYVIKEIYPLSGEWMV